MAYTYTHIKAIYAEFQFLKNYTDKLRFYDRHFRLIPFRFPDCDGDPYTLFATRNMTFLLKSLQEEREHPFQTVRTITVEGEPFTFSIRPQRSNYSAFNEYVVAKFLNPLAPRTAIFKRQTKISPLLAPTPAETIHRLLQLVGNGPQGPLRAQMVSVFYKGCTDFIRGQHSFSSRKKKFIELYLYAQGIRFAQRLETSEPVMQD